MADVDMVSRGGSLAKRKTTMDMAHSVTDTVAGGFSVATQVVGSVVIVLCFFVGAAYWIGNIGSGQTVNNTSPVRPTSVQMPWGR